MRRRTAKIWLSARSAGYARYLQAHRIAWLAALLVAANLAEGSPVGVDGGSGANGSRQQFFRLGRSQLAASRAG